MKMDEVEGIGPIYAEQARRWPASRPPTRCSSRAPSRAAGPPSRRRPGSTAARILEWVNHVDLMRIKGVGSEYSDLLEAAGVDSPAELAQRNAANLATTFQEVVAARPGMVRRVPTEAEVAGWIAEAKDLPKVVEH